jgi:formylglycine-generating enzyme required for sulfatase activity
MVQVVRPTLVDVPAGASLPAFRLGRTPVTNAEYAAYLEAGRAQEPPFWREPAFAAPGQPVVGITWFEAADYAAWLGEESGARLRLPRAAEWEHAACGGLARPATAWGDALPEGEMPDGPLEGPWLAGRGRPNGYGLCDMGTIVHEWCLDWFDTGATRRASRGGSWRHHVRFSAPHARSSLPPAFRYADYGFRVLEELATAQT